MSLRKGTALEERVLEMQFPDLGDLGRARSPEQWAAVLKDVRAEARRLAEMDPYFKDKFPAESAPGVPAEKSPELAAARKYLVAHGRPKAEVEAMPAAQALVLYLHDYAVERRDELFKLTYLPHRQAQPLLDADDARHRAAATEAELFAEQLLPAMKKVMAAQMRIERKISLLRVIEALRLHAAAHGGRL